jgi:hypothetical protein
MHKLKRPTKQELASTHGFVHRLIDAHGYSICHKKEKRITRVTVISLEFGETTIHKIRDRPSIIHDIAQQHNRDR